ncbi:MAG TPA: multicopper oxidase family protein [Verrucomicrobiae bacterium]|nr:multicopper oxidase family protein [Verrucomicrobiae bacterium]
MTAILSRRNFLASAGMGVGGLVLNRAPYARAFDLFDEAQPGPKPITLQATTRTLDINGKAATVMGLLQPNGTQGIESVVDTPFRVNLENKLTVPTAIHWHGLHPPNNEDGVPGVTQPPIRPNASVLYDFPLVPAGTHWMHSHQGLQEASLLAAPLIVHEKGDESLDEQQIVIMLGDFSFMNPDEIFAKLRAGAKKAAPMAMKMGAKPDANDWNYDAYLANDRTLNDPEVVKVEKSGRVRLRIINGSSGTNYFVDLGSLTGELIATDGMPIEPIRASRFPLAIAQRIDVRIQIPAEGGAFPILGLRELSREQTGIILTTPGATVSRLLVQAADATGLLTLDQEKRMVARHPLEPRSDQRSYVLTLGGNMAAYSWTIDGISFNVNDPQSEKAGVMVKQGERAVVKFVNETPMSHPMHLHGHAFQVIDINGQAINGAVRDTLLVTGKSSVTIAFDANNPGLWYLHCHVLWHLAAGMATLVQYEA